MYVHNFIFMRRTFLVVIVKMVKIGVHLQKLLVIAKLKQHNHFFGPLWCICEEKSRGRTCGLNITRTLTKDLKGIDVTETHEEL